jgi:hypothetical protein
MLHILPNQMLKRGCQDCEQLLRAFAGISRNTMLSIALSAIAFFGASYFIKRYLDNAGIATGMTRGVLIFSIALTVSYLVAGAADYLTR